MKYYFFILMFASFSCNTHTPISSPRFENMDMTFNNGWDIQFSIIINQDGNFVLAKGGNEKDFFRGSLKRSTLKTIDSLATRLLSMNDSLFVDSKIDQSSFGLVYTSKEEQKSFFMYGDTGPAELISLRTEIFSLATQNQFSTVDTSVKFKSEKKLPSIHNNNTPPR